MKLLESVFDSLDLLHRPKREIVEFIPYLCERGMKQDFGKAEADRISEVLSIPIGTVMSRLARARSAIYDGLQRILQPHSASRA
jgi:hypothetical protein